MATADDIYFPDDVLTGAQRRLVTSTAQQVGDNGVSGRLAKYDYPLLELTVTPTPDQSSSVEDLFFTQNGPERSFLVTPPLARDKVATGQPLIDMSVTPPVPAVGTGTAAGFQLAIAKTGYDSSGASRTVYKPIYHPVDSSLIVYANGVALSPSPGQWSLGILGSVTVYAPLGQTLTWDGDYDTAMHFVNDQIETTLTASSIEFVKGITIREAPGE
jgi:hypothetical protein